MSFGRGCIPFVLLAALPAIASAQSSGVELFNQCAEVKSDSERLACFDRVTREMRAGNRPGAPAGAAPARQQSAQQQREDFGLSVPQVRERRAPPAQIRQITAKVAAVKQIGQGYWAFLLEDGAVWQISEFSTSYLPPRPGDTVRLRRGLMGGYLLYARGQASVRVTRLS